MKLIKRSDSVTKEQKQLGISRRVFMRNSSLAAGGAIAGASLFAPGMIRKAEAKSVDVSAMLVYGKHFLKPYVPSEIWGFVVLLAKQYHNYMGPLFFILLTFILLKCWRKSIPTMTDVRWFMKLGGMVGKHKGTHPSAGFSNGGEKAIYWLLIFFGVFVAASGLILDFPIFGQTRRDMELSSLVHMISALILICGFIFHIYIGLFSMEGALEGMVTGEVDETWAKEHHDLWYAEMMEKEQQSGSQSASTNEQTTVGGHREQTS